MFFSWNLLDKWRKDVGLDLFFPQKLINSMKVNYPKISIHKDWTSTNLLALVNCKFKKYISSFESSLFVIQSKQLRKLIQQTFQQYATLKEDDCMVQFFEILKDFVSYDEEVFPCELVVSSNSVEQQFFPWILETWGTSSLLIFKNIKHSNLSTARLESVSGAGHRWERDSPTHTEEFGGKHVKVSVLLRGFAFLSYCKVLFVPYVIYLSQFQDLHCHICVVNMKLQPAECEHCIKTR